MISTSISDAFVPTRIATPATTVPAMRDFSAPTVNASVVFSRPFLHWRVMHSGMHDRVHHNEVFDPVIGLDSIDVVNNFIASQCAPKVLLHDQPVLFDRMAIDRQDNITVDDVPATLPSWVTGSSVTKVGALSRTIRPISSGQPCRYLEKRRTAVLADATHPCFHRSVFAGVTTVFHRVCLGGLGFKFLAALTASDGYSRLGSMASSLLVACGRAKRITAWRYGGGFFVERGSAHGADTIDSHRDLSSRCRAGGVRCTARLLFGLYKPILPLHSGQKAARSPF